MADSEVQLRDKIITISSCSTTTFGLPRLMSGAQVASALNTIIARLNEYDEVTPSKLIEQPCFLYFPEEPADFPYFPEEPTDDYVENSEKHLKKLIKYAKTPMERKAYEKQLNTLYKKRKRNEKSDRTTRQGNQES